MSISEIEEYMETNQKASLDELCLFFQVESNEMEEALDSMLASEQSQVKKKPSCGHCENCTCHMKKKYHWITAVSG